MTWWAFLPGIAGAELRLLSLASPSTSPCHPSRQPAWPLQVFDFGKCLIFVQEVYASYTKGRCPRNSRCLLHETDSRWFSKEVLDFFQTFSQLSLSALGFWRTDKALFPSGICGIPQPTPTASSTAGCYMLRLLHVITPFPAHISHPAQIASV